LKGSIKDVLYPDEKADQKKKRNEAKAKGETVDDKKDADQQAIITIAERYGIPADHEIIELWPNLKLDRLAHRERLGSPHQLSDVAKAWDELQLVLSVLLDSLDAGYTTVYERLDRLATLADPSAADLMELLQKTPNNPHTLSHFFGKADGSKWLGMLLGSPLFDDPPAHGYWPQVYYLSRVASDHPEAVAPILERIASTPNMLSILRVLEALPSLDVAERGRILLAAARSVMTLTGQDTYLAHEVAKRAATLATDDVTSALDIFETLLSLVPKTDKPEGGYLGSRELGSCLEYYTYSDIVSEPLHAVIQFAPVATFERLAALLDQALAAVYGDTRPNDYSKGWMPAIEPHHQNTYHYEPLPRLAEAVRDAAEAVIAADPLALQTFTDVLRAHAWQVFERLRLHLFGKFGNPQDASVQAAAVDEKVFFAYDERHEYGALLKRVFAALPAEEQAQIVAWIKHGAKEIPERADAEDRVYLRKSWAHLRLSWIREHLSDEDLAELEKLDGEFGGAEESAEFTGYMSGPFWGPTSPKNDDELKGLTLPELVAYLQRWQPSGEHHFARFGPTREGLARQLQPIVKARAAEFATNAEAFVGIDATYVSAIAAGFEDAIKEHIEIDWATILRLCEWAVSQPREIAGRDPQGLDNDPHWGWARAAIARLLRTGLSARDAAALPLTLREHVWAVLEPITDDPDPATERDTEERDPYSTAINSTRGVAMEAVMRYAMWVRQFYWVLEGVRGFSDMPEVERVLTRHLDRTVDASQAIRAVYGEFLFALFQMNGDWFLAHYDELFPADQPALADAVLRSYLAWGHWCTKELNDALRPQFARAIASFAAPNDEDKTQAYVGNVGQRLLLMYMHGELGLTDDSLLPTFFARADERTRAHMISLIPSFMKELTGGEKDAMRERGIQFWEWRLATSTDGDIRGFGRWMESEEFAAAWRLAQLETVLRRVGGVDADYQIAGMLGRFATAFPAETLRCARLLTGGSMNSMKVHALMYRHDLHRIIRAGLTSGNEALQKDATAFANELVARGFSQFRDVLEEGYKQPDEDDRE
jgi:hypothetical protein